MRSFLSVTGIMVSISLLVAPAAAAPLGAALTKDFAAQNQTGSESLATQIQYRRGYRGGYRGGYRDHDRGDDGAGVAAGILGGLMLGAIIANESQRNRGSGYCAQRYRSYDPGSGTYLGYDGYRHRCQ
jgi:hypothetical protein